MMDWLGKLLDLPSEFLSCSGGKGGGVVQVSFFNQYFSSAANDRAFQGTASEATLVSLLAAKSKAMKKVKETEPQMEEHAIVGRLIAYASGK